MIEPGTYAVVSLSANVVRSSNNVRGEVFWGLTSKHNKKIFDTATILAQDLYWLKVAVRANRYTSKFSTQRWWLAGSHTLMAMAESVAIFDAGVFREQHKDRGVHKIVPKEIHGTNYPIIFPPLTLMNIPDLYTGDSKIAKSLQDKYDERVEKNTIIYSYGKKD